MFYKYLFSCFVELTSFIYAFKYRKWLYILLHKENLYVIKNII